MLLVRSFMKILNCHLRSLFNPLKIIPRPLENLQTSRFKFPSLLAYHPMKKYSFTSTKFKCNFGPNTIIQTIIVNYPSSSSTFHVDYQLPKYPISFQRATKTTIVNFSIFHTQRKKTFLSPNFYNFKTKFPFIKTTNKPPISKNTSNLKFPKSPCQKMGNIEIIFYFILFE